MYWCFYCIALVIAIICPTANLVVSFLCTVDSIVDWCVVGNVSRFSFTVCLVMMSVDRCLDGSIDKRRIPCLIGMMEKSIFLSMNSSILFSSFLLIILFILLCMQSSYGWRCCSVHCQGGIVVVVLPIVWTTVDRFFEVIVDRFPIGTVDRCGGVSFDRRGGVSFDQRGGVSFDRRGILCLVLCSTVTCCYESWIIDSSGGRMWLYDWNWIVVDMWVYEG